MSHFGDSGTLWGSVSAPRQRLRLVPPSEEPPDQEVAAVPEFDDAFRKYVPYVARIGFKILGDSDAVDDLVQDVFVEAHRRWSDIRDGDAVKGWLATLTVRMARKRLQRRRRRALLWRRDAAGAPLLLRPGTSPEQRTLLAQIFGVLERIPTDQRVAWCLRHLEGAQLDEVAALCNCSRATAKRRIAAAHEVLTKAIYDG